VESDRKLVGGVGRGAVLDFMWRKLIELAMSFAANCTVT